MSTPAYKKLFDQYIEENERFDATERRVADLQKKIDELKVGIVGSIQHR
nr:hypothetical protein [Candidatus Sigynarchaeum springense]